MNICVVENCTNVISPSISGRKRIYCEEHRNSKTRSAQMRQRRKIAGKDVYESQKKYFQTEKGKVKRRNTVNKWYANNTKQANIHSTNHRARKLNAEGSFTEQEFVDKCILYRWRCRYCKCKLTYDTVTRDHVIPLVRGGSNYIHNIVPCCSLCNSSKGDKTGIEYIRYRIGLCRAVKRSIENGTADRRNG